jgi:hypothetical protein
MARGRKGSRGGGKTPATKRNTRSSDPINSRIPDTNPEPQHFSRARFQTFVSSVIRDALPEIVSEVLNATEGHLNHNNGNGGPEMPIVTEDDSVIQIPRKGCPYKSFKGCDPPKFDGRKSAMATYQWIHEMEAIIDISGCTIAQAVKYATHSFVSEALFWWDNIKQAKGHAVLATLTWEDLKNLIMSRFCPMIGRGKIEREFIILGVGTMTLQQYITKFDEMARLLLELVQPKSQRVKRFVQGLPCRIRQLVKMSAPQMPEC